MSATLCCRGVIVALLAAIGACTSARSPGRTLEDQEPGGNALLREQEIARADAGTVYEAIRQLRPSFLIATRGSTDELSVFVDGVRVGGIDMLRSIPSTTVREARRLSPVEATHRFGPGNSAGAILIVMKSGGPSETRSVVEA